MSASPTRSPSRAATPDRRVTATVWAVRLGWLLLPALVGPALTDALDGRSDPVRWVATGIGWAAWLGGLVALLVPSTVALTAVRLLAPAAPAAAAAAALAGASAGRVGLGLAAGTVVAGLAFLPEVGQHFVQGSAYGDETRFPLRSPGALLLGPVPLFWAEVAAALTVGPLLLAARQWLVGGLAVGVGLPLAGLLVRRLHRLTRRFLVFVPAGVVVHDHVALADTAMVRRTNVTLVHAAPADTSATDLTCGALGLAVELRFADPVPVTLAGTPAQRGGVGVVTDRVLVTPSRPGAVLAEAGRRTLPVR